MDMKVMIKHKAIVEGFRTLNDGTCKFSLACQEMGAEKAGHLVMLNGKFVNFIVSEEKIEFDDMPTDSTTSTAPRPKSKSQRLRNTLYVLWEQSNSEMEFDNYYEMMMERIIDFYKQKLD